MDDARLQSIQLDIAVEQNKLKRSLELLADEMKRIHTELETLLSSVDTQGAPQLHDSNGRSEIAGVLEILLASHDDVKECIGWVQTYEILQSSD